VRAVTQEPIPEPVRETYGSQDLSTGAGFAGGFINFGLWTGGDPGRPVTTEDRVRSQQELYRRVLAELEPLAGQRVLEVGCGLGLGCALTLAEFGPARITGLDLHPDQLERARAANAEALAANPERLRFHQGAAGDMPFGDGEFDRLYSVEAAQHFRELRTFARQAARVLTPGGRFAVTTFFVPEAAPSAADARLAGLLHSFASGLDVPHRIEGFTRTLTGAGFTEVRAEPIGESVWPGFDRFLDGVEEVRDAWPRNFLPAYREGLLDYFLVTGTAGP
jgi:cyclopropane fatty-acyl-phospholipid synthase-like methyltransferase